ncbi:MAG TPA: hypothetical protein VG435_13680 [Acidimicrobiales bacterium]|jgi:hypothetical protein|nr:hypothetical protein [Acidimicrobiales bacterium]
METTDQAPLRVVQWTTGNVGRRSVMAIQSNPGLELVGCFAWDPDKVGRDVGELCGIDPIGVTATDDIDALLDLKPDCVVYNPKWLDIEEMARILAAGINIVSTAAFITGHMRGAGRDRLVAACEQGRASLFGSGINPGFANLLAMVTTGMSDRVDCVTVLESADSTGYDSPETEIPIGFGRPLDDPGLPAMVRSGTAVFEEAVHMMADALGVELDEVRCEAEVAAAPEEVVMKSWTIAAGTVAGVAASWQGWAGGHKRIDLQVRWRKGPRLEPDWKVGSGYSVKVEGRPTVRLQMHILPPADFEARSLDDFMVLGMIGTALPAVAAVPAVCAAGPGIVTYGDLPLITARGFVGNR